MQSIYVDINCKGLFQNGINFGSSALFNLKSDEVGDTGDWICDCGERNKRKFCADLSFRHWRVENEKSDFYKWNHGRRENSNKQRIAKTFIKLCFSGR